MVLRPLILRDTSAAPKLQLTTASNLVDTRDEQEPAASTSARSGTRETVADKKQLVPDEVDDALAFVEDIFSDKPAPRRTTGTGARTLPLTASRNTVSAARGVGGVGSGVSSKPAAALSNAGDLQHVTPEALRLAKVRMDVVFEANRLAPGDPEYEYDKRAQFNPSEASDWD